MPRPSPARVAARYADLNPPLGYPGGPCHVMQRIRDEVRNPKLQEKLVDSVEDGDKLSNPEAAAIYDLEVDRGAGRFKKLRITPHAQYRMDQRGIIVNELRIALKSFQKAWNDDKSRQGYRWRNWEEDMARGQPIRWEDPQIKLAVVFTANRDVATLVTAYWEGQPDPRPEDEDSCSVRVGLKIAPTPGVQTYVTEDSAKGIPPSNDSREPDSAAPLPGSAVPGGAGREIGKFEYNTPDSSSDIKPRTLSEPGEQRGHPTNVLDNYITRRTFTSALVEAWEAGPPGPRRQHRQKPAERRRQNREEYRPNRMIKRRMALKRYHQFCKRNRQCKMKRELYRKHPQRYKRRAPRSVKKLPRLLKEGGDIILYDQWNPANNEIKQPGPDVNYRAEGPTTYEFRPDEREGVPPGHAPPSNQTEDVPPASSRVIPDEMKENLRDNLTYVQAAPNLRVAATIGQVLSKCDSTILNRAKAVRISPYRFNPAKGFWSFKAAGSQGTYIVRVKGVRRGNVKNLDKAQIKVSCSCPFFRWQGPEHWAKQGQYLYGRPVGTASNPKVMDPKGHHGACKHVVAALSKARGWRFSSEGTLWDQDAVVILDEDALLSG